MVKRPGYNHEEAVRTALQEGAADESQREIFTQIEEERNTIERVERYVDHQYFLREYVVRVNHFYLTPVQCRTSEARHSSES